MTLVGILHAIGTAGFQIFQTLMANGVGTVAGGHILNIFGALAGWIIEGLTFSIFIGIICGILFLLLAMM